MTEELKGHVTVSRTINLGNYNSVRVEFGQEYYIQKEKALDIFEDCMIRLDVMVEEAKR